MIDLPLASRVDDPGSAYNALNGLNFLNDWNRPRTVR